MSQGNVIYDGMPFCAQPEIAPARDGLCQWPQRPATIKWTFQSAQLSGIETEAFKAAIELAFSFWVAVCDIRPAYVESNQPFNLLIDYQSGQPGGVLADCQLPCNASSNTQLLMRIDRSENWVVSSNPTPNKIDLIGVLAHELGHAIGLDHAEGAVDLMNPRYRAGLRKPGPLSIPQAQLRYGPPVPITPPTPVPTPGGEWIEVAEALFKQGKIFVRKQI